MRVLLVLAVIAGCGGAPASPGEQLANRATEPSWPVTVRCYSGTRVHRKASYKSPTVVRRTVDPKARTIMVERAFPGVIDVQRWIVEAGETRMHRVRDHRKPDPAEGRLRGPPWQWTAWETTELGGRQRRERVTVERDGSLLLVGGHADILEEFDEKLESRDCKASRASAT